MTTILKQLLAKRGILSMEEQAADADKDKEQVGDGGSTPDGSEANPEEVTPTTPPEEVPPTEEVPSKEEEEEPGAEEAGGEEPGEAEPAPAEGEEPEPTPAEGGEQEPAPETPNPDEGGAEPSGEEEEVDDDFDDEDDSDEDGDFDEEEFDDTVEELTETQKADLAMINLIDKVRETLADGGLSGREATMVADRAGAILGKIEIEASPTPSMECFGSFGDRRTSTQLTLEALQEDQKEVGKKKEGLVAKVLAFIKEILANMFSSKNTFTQRANTAMEHARKIEGKKTVVLKGAEGFVAAFAAVVDKDTFTTQELNVAMLGLASELKSLTAKFRTSGPHPDAPEGFVKHFVSQTHYLKNLGMDRQEYTARTGEYLDKKISITTDANQQKALISAFGRAYDEAEASTKILQTIAEQCIVSENGQALNEMLGIMRMVGNVSRTGPSLAIRLSAPAESEKTA